MRCSKSICVDIDSVVQSFTPLRFAALFSQKGERMHKRGRGKDPRWQRHIHRSLFCHGSSVWARKVSPVPRLRRPLARDPCGPGENRTRSYVGEQWSTLLQASSKGALEESSVIGLASAGTIVCRILEEGVGVAAAINGGTAMSSSLA